jgi:hypothetical protein
VELSEVTGRRLCRKDLGQTLIQQVTQCPVNALAGEVKSLQNHLHGCAANRESRSLRLLEIEA